MNSSTQEMYRRKIQEIANDYETRGYRVLIEPAPTELPPFLANFHPDIVAYGQEQQLQSVTESWRKRFSNTLDGIFHWW